MQGINTIYPIIIGNNTVQHTDINWSKRILGKEALTQIKTKIKKAVFIAKYNDELDKLKEIVSRISLLNVILIILKK